jgi:hypothetical protein
MTEVLHFCRFWGMNPRQVDELRPEEYEAMIRYAAAEQREQRRRQREIEQKLKR